MVPRRAVRGYEPVFLQAQKRFTDGALATADLVSEPELGEHRLGLKLIQHDPTLDVSIDHVGRPQQFGCGL